MSGHSITFVCLIAAIILYAVGMALPATTLIVLGMVAEAAFWLRLFGMRRGNNNSP